MNGNGDHSIAAGQIVQIVGILLMVPGAWVEWLGKRMETRAFKMKYPNFPYRTAPSKRERANERTRRNDA